ncbi:LysR family transcriptional regulator [Arthrobacter nitrophenolicus]|uniref:LysR family transcriptional regulator n=2 Tax=Arthrobacter nitrophenolicus TaxID=683150 RepID=A0A4R5XPC2_9MICC|nr:LysR family transcriptional regulator [Arthrobacter nitrophenolicus]
MEVRWMKTFLAVAEELHFGRAAQQLHIAQPAVSQQIVNLEKYLGIQLFERNKRTVRLTDAGEAFLEPCRESLRSIHAAASKARNAGTGEFGRIRIGFNGGFASDHLVALVRAINRAYPHIELVIDSTRRNPEVIKKVEKQDLDIGLVGGPVKAESLSWHTLWEGKLGVLLPTDHPLARMSRVPTLALREEPLILIAPAPGWTVRSMAEEACHRAGFTPNKIIEVNDALTVFALINAGVGVGFASTGAHGTTANSLVLRPLAEDYVVQNSIVWKSGTETPALRNVLRLAEDLAEDLRLAK